MAREEHDKINEVIHLGSRKSHNPTTERHIFVTLQKLDAQAPYAIGLSDTDQVSDT